MPAGVIVDIAQRAIVEESVKLAYSELVLRLSPAHAQSPAISAH